MALGSPTGEHGTLEPRIHRATLPEIEQVFVHEAPFAEQRAPIFAALNAWVASIDMLLPGARLWLDGGFITHKSWAAPSDADIVAHHPNEIAEAWSEAQVRLLKGMLTNGDTGERPMGGLIDAYWFASGNSQSSSYWKDLWTRVRGRDGLEVIGHSKGFVEVIRP